jgi:type II secretory pathway pseudopilin PulG
MRNKTRENNKYLKSFKLVNKQGFSLMEVMSVLFIVMVGMVGVMSLVLQNIQVKDINTNRIIAHQLAQEGIELIRKQRDTNWIVCENAGSTDPACWVSNIEPGFSYKVDFKDEYPAVVSSIENAKLYKDTSLGYEDMYVHAVTSKETPFYRMIEIETVNNHSIYITTTVNWDERGQTYSYSAETVLYNWK